MPDRARPTALIVDDDATGRIYLRRLLAQAGYDADAVSSGEEALVRFQPEKHRVVFMDLMMPGIDGVDTTRRLKAREQAAFTPIIFLSGADDESSLVRAIEAGGDDFLHKPASPGVVMAKLRAMERIRAMHEDSRRLVQRMLDSQVLAREVLDHATGAHRKHHAAIGTLYLPAEQFCGDLLLSARGPAGELIVLLGDFTGHGLAAALGAMPVAGLFHAFAPTCGDLLELLSRLNRRICETLPRGHFMAAAALSFDPGGGFLQVANCGLPPLLLRSATGDRTRVSSGAPPLGVLADPPLRRALQRREVGCGERLAMASDGITEALSPEGEPFGQARLETVLSSCSRETRAPAAVAAALEAFTRGRPLSDDACFVEIDFDGWMPTPACLEFPLNGAAHEDPRH